MRASDGGRELVVVAEDEDDIREAVVLTLLEAGYRVIDVASVEDLARVLATEKPVIALLDLHLRGGTSEPIVAELVARETPPAILLISASTEAERLAEHHKVALLPKPFDLDTLLGHVERARDSQPFRAQQE
jgi:two-component system, response regulator PdtaR